MNILNILMLILTIVFTGGFAVYCNFLRTEQTYKNKTNKIFVNIITPAVILFVAIYSMASFVVGYKTRSVIVNNPEILIEASTNLQVLEQKRAAEAIKKEIINISENDVQSAPIIGNPDGEVVIYEFFDYNCGWCKYGAESIKEILSTEKDVKVVLKNFPYQAISITPAKAIIAAKEQGKVAELHALFMTNNLRPEEGTEQEMNENVKAIVFGLAQKANLDLEKLKKDMESPAVEEEILRTRQLAEKLQLQGTPAYIIGEQAFPGYIDANKMRTAIQKAR